MNLNWLKTYIAGDILNWSNLLKMKFEKMSVKCLKCAYSMIWHFISRNLI